MRPCLGIDRHVPRHVDSRPKSQNVSGSPGSRFSRCARADNAVPQAGTRDRPLDQAGIEIRSCCGCLGKPPGRVGTLHSASGGAFWFSSDLNQPAVTVLLPGSHGVRVILSPCEGRRGELQLDMTDLTVS